MQELKQLGFWKSRVEKLEKENKSLRHEIKNAKRQHAMQTSLFIKRRSATAKTGAIEDNARNETVSPSHPQSPAGYMPSSNQETTLMGGDEDEDDHSNMSDQQIIKYQKIQLQNASARQEELIQRISHLSNALANARAYPLLQTRVGECKSFIYTSMDVYIHIHTHTHTHIYIYIVCVCVCVCVCMGFITYLLTYLVVLMQLCLRELCPSFAFSLESFEIPAEFSDVVFFHLYISDMNNFSVINEEYCEYMSSKYMYKCCLKYNLDTFNIYIYIIAIAIVIVII